MRTNWHGQNIPQTRAGPIFFAKGSIPLNHLHNHLVVDQFGFAQPRFSIPGCGIMNAWTKQSYSWNLSPMTDF
jgi:hypothetical protein